MKHIARLSLVLAFAAPALAEDVTVTLRVLRGEPPRFSQRRISAQPGQRVVVTFHNNSTDRKHVWLLVRPGKVPDVVALGPEAGSGPGDTDYNPDVLAGTRTLKPGEKETVDFEAPDKPGIYPFISTVGDDPTTMTGVLIVRKPPPLARR